MIVKPNKAFVLKNVVAWAIDTIRRHEDALFGSTIIKALKPLDEFQRHDLTAMRLFR